MRSKTLYAILLIFSFAVLSCVAWYIFAPKRSFEQLAVTFSRADLPITKVKVEEEYIPLAIDLGSKFHIGLEKDRLAKIAHKKPFGMAHWRDYKGMFYTASSYLVPKIQVGNFTWENVVVVEKNDDCETNAVLWRNTNGDVNIETLGTLGRPILEKINLLLDFPHSTVVAIYDAAKFENEWPSFKDAIKVPFGLGQTGIILQVDTDIGLKNISLDTGATLTHIKISSTGDAACRKDAERGGLLYFTTSKFVIGGTDFGNMDIYPLNFPPEANESDGILGMSFLKHHVLYIDYPRRVIYIEKVVSPSELVIAR